MGLFSSRCMCLTSEAAPAIMCTVEREPIITGRDSWAGARSIPPLRKADTDRGASSMAARQRDTILGLKSQHSSSEKAGQAPSTMMSAASTDFG